MDIMPTMPISGTGTGGNDFIALLLIFALFGKDGFGANSGNEVYQSQQFTQLDNGIRAVQNGICDLGFSLNNSIKDGFSSLYNGMSSLFFGMQASIQGLSSQIAQCCCDLGKEILVNRYEAQKNTCDIITAGNANTQKILDYMCAKETATLRDENLFLKLRNCGY